MKSPQKWLVKLYQPEIDCVKWRFLLSFLGVESIPIQNEKELTQTLLHDQTGLIIIDRTFLSATFSANESNFSHWIERGGGIALTGEAGHCSIPVHFLDQVTDIAERDPFIINALLQRFVPTYSRLHPRLETRLPGLYARAAGGSQICEIMNLGPGGAFIRTTETLPLSGEELQVNVPLMGLHKEIELSSRVVRQVLPNEVNNYSQGIGVSFVAERNSSAFIELNNYVRYILAHDEALDPQVTPFSGCRAHGKDIANTSLTARQMKGREPALAPIR